ncbi:MAG: hypothetical protein Q8O37_08320 [Sulfuricellaceae bacterium]|nr:hypothetical protein [Sulfuricellaceae bacterium]
MPSPPPSDTAEAEATRHRAASRYLWAMLLARIYEACPICHAPKRIIAFINDANTVWKILANLGESTLPPKIAPARGPPLWDAVADFRQGETILDGIRWHNLNRSSSSISVSLGDE